MLYAAFGSSRHLVTGPMSATAALSAAAVADVATGDDFAAFTDGAGDRHRRRRRSLAGLLRLGFLANFISEPVLKGFIIGLALTIIIGQVPKLFGVEKRGRATSSSSCGASSRNLGDTQARTLVVGADVARRRAGPAPVRAGRARRRSSP